MIRERSYISIQRPVHVYLDLHSQQQIDVPRLIDASRSYNVESEVVE